MGARIRRIDDRKKSMEAFRVRYKSKYHPEEIDTLCRLLAFSRDLREYTLIPPDLSFDELCVLMKSWVDEIEYESRAENAFLDEMIMFLHNDDGKPRKVKVDSTRRGQSQL
jgi:hypothetical protein